MKSVLMAALLMLGSVAFAQESSAPAAAPAAAPAKKASKKEAVAECKKVNKDHKSQAYKDCMKEKGFGK
jgi:hypothetical protein